jgi:hypothetical protein
MARGTPLSRLVVMLRDELRRASTPSIGADDLASLRQVLNRNYRILALDHDWPHLMKVSNRMTLYAGQRYYDLPDQIDYDRIINIIAWYSSEPYELMRGIDFADYATYDPELDERSEPVLKWDIRWTGDTDQLEIWPLPNTNAQQLQIRAIRELPALVDDTDKCLLDDQLVVAFAAAELATAQKSADAEIKAGQAQRLLGMLKARSNNNQEEYRVGLGRDDANGSRPYQAVVRVSSSGS